uniref:O-methyltransferase domain-containing protein n=1 Tax=Oryza meridionalis TaxID=40149 RepID=A0A0E0F503_9ORYZ
MAGQAPNMLAPPTDDELLNAQADLWRHSLYFVTSMAFQCAVKLGIPTAIHRAGGSASLPDLVAALSLPPAKLPFLRRLMRLLVNSGVFAAADDTATGSAGMYRLTPLSWLLVEGEGAAPVVDGHPSQVLVVLAATSRHCVEAAMGLADWFGKDLPPSSSAPPSPFEEVHGAALFDESMANLDPESDSMFNEALAAHDHSGFPTVLRECREVFQGVESLTDCRGGDGRAAKAIVEAFPHIKCTVLDFPRVIGETRTGVVNYVAGDMFCEIPPAQAVMLQLVLHHWNDEDCVKILANCKKAIPTREDGGKVIIIDIVIGAPSGLLLEAQLLMDVAMMVVTKGRQRDENDWRDLFSKAGFSDYNIVKKLGARGVFELLLHHWNVEDNVQILAQCNKTIPNGEYGWKVIIIDIVNGAPSGLLLEAQLLINVVMMVVTKGRQRDENEWRDLFKTAGTAGFSDWELELYLRSIDPKQCSQILLLSGFPLSLLGK